MENQVSFEIAEVDKFKKKKRAEAL